MPGTVHFAESSEVDHSRCRGHYRMVVRAAPHPVSVLAGMFADEKAAALVTRSSLLIHIPLLLSRIVSDDPCHVIVVAITRLRDLVV